MNQSVSEMSYYRLSAQRVHAGSHNGLPLYKYTLENSKGMRAVITNYGATVMSLLVPDRSGTRPLYS